MGDRNRGERVRLNAKDRRERGEAGETEADGEVEDGFLSLQHQREDVARNGDDDDKGPPHPDLGFLTKFSTPP